MVHGYVHPPTSLAHHPPTASLKRQNAMREPERALALHKARVLTEIHLYSASTSTASASASSSSSDATTSKEAGGAAMAIGSTEWAAAASSLLVPKCLRVR